MLMTDEQKRWLVVGISLHKVLAPKLRSYVENGLKNHYTTLDGKYSLTTLTYDKCVCTCKCKLKRKAECKDKCTCDCTCGAYEELQVLKFENINGNARIGKKKADCMKYNYNINNPVDLAKLYLPDYLARFSGFDDSLDMSAMLRLLGFSKPTAPPIIIFPSPSPLVSIQAAADDVRENVRNKWAHCKLEKEWTQDFYDNYFVKLKNLVESLGLGREDETQLKDELSDWQSKGCVMCMGHTVDKNLLQLVQQEVENLSQQCKDLYQEFPDLKNKLEDTMERLNQMEEEVKKLKEESKKQGEKVENLEEESKKQGEKVENLEEESKKQGEKVENLEEESKKQGEKVENLEGKMTEVKRDVGELKQRLDGAMPQDEKVMKVPPLQTEIMHEYKKRHSWIHPFPWLEHFQLALKDVFTRLKIIVREKGMYVPSNKTVGMFEVFEPHEHDCEHPKRVLVEADPGMGKTTFSEKLCLDWATGENMQPFPLLPLVIFLKCRDLISDDIMDAMVDQLLPKDVSKKDKSALLKYVQENQSKILLVVDGFDELRKEVDLSDLIQRKILSKVHLLVTTRQEAGISIRQYFDSLFEITGYTISDAKEYIRKYFEFIKEEEKGEPLLQKIDEAFHDDGRAKTEDAAYLRELLSNPLRTSLLCAVSEDSGGELPARRTQLYTEISKCILRRHFKKENPEAELPDDPIEHYREDMLILGKLAFRGIENNQLYFDAKELEGHSPNIAKFDFLSKEAATSKTKAILRYYFLHKPFQEYLAAFYLCEQFSSGEVVGERLIREISVGIFNFTQVFCFSAGILAGKRATAVLDTFMKDLTRVLSTDLDSFLLLCDCVLESSVEEKLGPEQVQMCAAIGQEMRWEKLWLRKIGDENSGRYKVLCEVLKSNSTVKYLDLNYNSLTDVSLLMNSLKRNTTLRILRVRGNPINHTRAELKQLSPNTLTIYSNYDKDDYLAYTY